MYRTHPAQMMTTARTQHWLPREEGVPGESAAQRRPLLDALQLARQLHAEMGSQLIPSLGAGKEAEAEAGANWGRRLRAAAVPRLPRGSAFFLWAPSEQERLLRDAGALGFFLSYVRRLLLEQQPEERSLLASPLASLRRALAALCERLGSALRPAGQPHSQRRLRLLHPPPLPQQQQQREGGGDAADDEEDDDDGKITEQEEDRQLEGALKIPAAVMLRELQAWVERTVRDLSSACELHHEMM